MGWTKLCEKYENIWKTLQEMYRNFDEFKLERHDKEVKLKMAKILIVKKFTNSQNIPVCCWVSYKWALSAFSNLLPMFCSDLYSDSVLILIFARKLVPLRCTIPWWITSIKYWRFCLRWWHCICWWTEKWNKKSWGELTSKTRSA